MLRLFWLPLIVFVVSLIPQPGIWANGEIDVEYAQMLPLAPKSMLLDITRISRGFVAVGERGHIITSTDGRNWVQAEHVPTRATLTTVFSLGDRLWAGGHDATLLTSGDGGRNWTLQFQDPDRQQAVMDILFFDKKKGMALGSYGLALFTEDAGQTWEDFVVDEDNEFHLNSIVRLDDSRLMIAGEAGYSYRSFDGGFTWEPLDLPYTGSMWGSILLPNGCVVFYGLRGHIQKSCDFGENWEELPSGVQTSLSGTAFHNGLLVFVGNSGRVLTRDDGGKFTAYDHSSGVDFSAVIALDDGTFLLAGEEGVHRFPEEEEGGDDQ
jgi:photosystem II stability/assembly factor-like uncharacterized protein